MEPGKAYSWKIDLMPTAVLVKRGHKVALLIASQDSRRSNRGHCFSDYRDGCYNPSGILPDPTSAGRAVNTVFTGAGGTTVEWDWADPRKTAKAPAQ